MPDSRKARREADPGLQPERTSLAWLRTLLGYGALMVLAVRHNWQQAGLLFWTALGILAAVALLLWYYTRSRTRMDVSHYDFSASRTLRSKFLISLAVFSLALLFAAGHVHHLISLIRDIA
ncbi:DUF202 domain-containing protein [Enterobacter hormaechei]|uniref:DUF202 domain-containing protein n=1 Tax=Enterobacter hormaechei TaxID=158836 RepID=UPI000F676D4C|nr:DUF202 domain-containing protein [Enterobacter hormaechei]MBN4764646.1 DUF202 domain-containing protein [Enterobacter hormaechei]MCO7366449.1 DUF202 domain-containing protein [Enterobacter hormaechei]QXR32123.1 DUF202 domain-containing protein [Enterobacter hormaechei]